jgi:competence protein ComEC
MMPLFWIALAFLLGILCGSWLTLPLWAWAGLSLLLLALTIFGRKYYRRLWLFRASGDLLRVWPVVLILFVALGGLRFELAQPRFTPADLAWYNDRGNFILTAVVDKSPDRRESATYLHVSARELYDPAAMTFTRVQGAALVKTAANADIQLGDVLRFAASPKMPSDSDDFSYRAYLERSGIYTVLYYPTSLQKVGLGEAGWFALILETLRRKTSDTIFALYPQPESGLLAGILLGNDNDLPESLNRAYRDTGTAHIIAISGFNMVMLTRLMTLLFSKLLDKKRTMLLTAIVLIVYSLFIGNSPSVWRAAVMAIFAFGGELIGRRHAGLNGLGLTAGLMMIQNPSLPWDASFQLSFLATLGMLLFAAPMQDWLVIHLENRFSEAAVARLNGPINDYLISSLAAQIMTLPVIALQFHRLSLISLLANPLVLPVQPAIWIGGMLAVIFGLLWLPLGRVIGAFTWPLLAWSNGAASLLSRWQGSAVTLTPVSALVISLTCAVLVLLFLIRKPFMKIFKKINWLNLVFLLVLAFGLTAAIIFRSPDGRLHLSMIRAGNGSALLLRAPSGATLLIDPNSSTNELASAASARLSPWNFHVDAALFTSRESANSLASLNERLPVRRVVLTQPLWLTDQKDSPLSLPVGVSGKQLGEYEIMQIEEGLTIQPMASDNGHTALLMVYGDTRILVPGGVSPALLFANPADNLSSLSVLILNEEDIVNLPADMWLSLDPQVVFWNSTSIAPVPSWKGLQEFSTVNLVGDGSAYSIE